jgi:hypothetical protein
MRRLTTEDPARQSRNQRRYGYFTTKVAKATEFPLLHLPPQAGRKEVGAILRDLRVLRGEFEFARKFRDLGSQQICESRENFQLK